MQTILTEAYDEMTALAIPEELQHDVNNTISAVDLIQIETDADYAACSAIGEQLKAAEKQVIAFFEPHVENANKLHKGLTSHRKTTLQPILDRIDRLKLLMKQYNQRKEAERLAEQQRIATELRKQAEAERLALAARAEETAKASGADQVQTSKAVDAVLNAPPPMDYAKVARQIAPTAPPVKVQGSQVRKTWTYEITDEALIPGEYWILNEKAIKAAVTSLKERCNIPGVRAFQESDVAFGGR